MEDNGLIDKETEESLDKIFLKYSNKKESAKKQKPLQTLTRPNFIQRVISIFALYHPSKIYQLINQRACIVNRRHVYFSLTLFLLIGFLLNFTINENKKLRAENTQLKTALVEQSSQKKNKF